MIVLLSLTGFAWVVVFVVGMNQAAIKCKEKRERKQNAKHFASGVHCYTQLSWFQRLYQSDWKSNSGMISDGCHDWVSHFTWVTEG